MKAMGWFVAALSGLLPAIALGIDWTDIPVVQDDACEFRNGLWHTDTAKRHGLRTIRELHDFGIRRAQERCRNGMVLMISTTHSGEGRTLEATLSVARALCRVPDIQQSQRRAFEQYYLTDVRCTISKIDVNAPNDATIEPNR